MHIKKTLLVLFIGIQTLKITAQQAIRGSFSFISPFVKTGIKFKGNSKFQYHRNTCTERKKGSGTYSINNNELTLLFDDPTDKKFIQNPSYSRQETCTNNSLLSFYFFDLAESVSIPYVTVRYFNTTKSTFYGVSGDSAGYAKLRVPNDQFPINMLIRCVGAEEKSIRLDSAGDHIIKFPINIGFDQYFNKGDTLKFFIGEFTGEFFTLRPEGIDHFLIFKRQL